MSRFVFSDANLKKIALLQKRYPQKASLVLPLLWMAQYQETFISLEAMKEIAQILDTSPAEVYGIATFYTMFRLKPTGKYHIEVCKTLSCKLCGKDQLLKHLEEKYGMRIGETTPDGKFTLSVVECMGACAGAPMISLNEVYHEKLTPEILDTLIRDLP